MGSPVHRSHARGGPSAEGPDSGPSASAAAGFPVLTDPCPPKTRADLEWDRVLAALGERCVSERGRAAALELPFLSTRAAIITALREIDEARGADDRGEPVPRAKLADLGPALDRVRLGASLSGEEIRGVAAALGQARTLRKWLKARGEEASSLRAVCDTDASLDALAHELEKSFDDDGGLADGASPRLFELRQEQRAQKARLLRRLEELVARHRELLSDGYWTERDGRYVLPVRADAHLSFPGIVHATSGGGSTLFVEPRLVVPLGNRQKVLDATVAREEEVVLAALSGRIAERAGAIEDALAALAHADLRGACARLANDLDLTTPEVLDPQDPEGMRIALRAGRHPLLQLDGVEVVASDLSARARRALVISGPNAGGKTVALKTLGLAALAVRAGLPIAAGSGSSLAPFDVVLTDVGDDQSLIRNLSTFSAHVKNLSAILDRTGRGTLVLLDELAGGTDPREGEALATSILEAICEQGGAAACTTHYEALKTLALSDERFENASVGFDLETMTPTFRVAMGVAGASSALAVARRFGIEDRVIDRAEELLGPEVQSVSELVAKLAADRRALDEERATLQRELAAARTHQADLDAERERMLVKEKGKLTKEGEALLDGVKKAREDLRVAQTMLKQTPSPGAVKEAERKIAAVAQQVALGGALEPRRNEEPDRGTVRGVTVGMKVFVPRLRTEADVIEVLGNGQVRVAAGPLKLLTSVEELRQAKATRPSAPQKAAASREQARRAIAFDAAADPDVPIQTADNSVDLRGLRAHEAVAMAEQFLDRCVGHALRVAFLIHGHGTGALRQAIRDAVRSSPYVDRSRPGEGREGGDGVTVVWLK